jgi:hypothetical protein
VAVDDCCSADRRQRVPRPQPFAEPRRLRRLSKHPVPLPPLTDGRALRRRQAGMKTSAEPGECSHLEARGNSAPPRPEQYSWRRRTLRPGEGELSDRGDVPPDCQPNERLGRPNARPSASWLLLLTSESGGRLFPHSPDRAGGGQPPAKNACGSSSIANATRVSDRRSIHPKAATLGDVSHAPSGLPRHIGGCHDGVVASATCVKRALAPGYE